MLRASPLVEREGRTSPIATPCAAAARARPVPPLTPTCAPAPASEPPPDRGRPPPTKPRASDGTLGPAHPSSTVADEERPHSVEQQQQPEDASYIHLDPLPSATARTCCCNCKVIYNSIGSTSLM
ncbi:hypothetical protein BDA96_07G144400 [Sorghum bicolor]|uniref:Uncharacterized protein n=2 Tax=Sorghum bicolor TaxID=4558 RepID=A0A921QNM2_SORBI|nr:ena/VASP-like protein isoform X2 [Sorghum bicolor]KAG0523684.1 hypothetical protein BDA96_07G144400 [Sorghum bicolor]KAG0523686.1 hypothetical protein BDA96_07G144400 [Sorghum bicolor]KAG0523689.1 hypothetical protein BDA96_07G144400 [Sorghum bicolor]OQU80493.1 hypothetical protein SORBI_3007G134300 [Sorghum bicolor]OQU80494.1 hypothetical protein SORBI_3007G134300 [Sorghum bicolor]|eukprot:XP_021320111.1 ena/VASP-like protein isoform X2 [Sorghum bicolor]